MPAGHPLTTLRGFPRLAQTVRTFLAAGLMLDPWLAGLQQEHFELHCQQWLADDAAQLAARYWNEPLISETLGTYPLPRRMGMTAAHEVLTSTAAVLAHERRGQLRIGEEEATEAMARVHRLVRRKRGFGTLVLVHGLVTFVENHIALRHYTAMAEKDFVDAALHRPWVSYTLDDELLVGLLLGVMRLEVRDGRRWVVQTPQGERAYQEASRILETSGYLERRLQLIYLSQFNLFADWDTQVARMVPDAGAGRQAFTAFAGITAGMTVLEAGCGMATQTFEGGLWDAVGPTGSIVGSDPAPGMLERAREKAKQRDARNVSFVRAQAEDLAMFRDGQFDAAIGMSFLHFTDAPAALRELRRVTRPGGTVAIAGPCQYALDQDWFRDWFGPILALAQQHQGKDANHSLLPGRLPAPGEMARWFQEAGLQAVATEEHPTAWTLLEPEASVAFMVQGVSFFQRELELLPWQARQDLIAELKRKGAAICAATTPEQRTLRWPAEFVKGTVPPA